MKTAIILAIVCLGLAQALTQDDIKGFGKKAEAVVKCVIDTHGDIDDVEDLVEQLETLAAGNEKVEGLKNAVAGFLKALGFEIDPSRGFFGLAVDVFNGIKKAYEEGKDDEVLQFVDGLMQVVPPKEWEEAGKVIENFMKSENLGQCKDAEKRGLGARKDMSALFNVLKRALALKKK